MVSKETNEFIDMCVNKSLDHYREGLITHTMLSVAQDTSLHPDFDPFDMLAYELMSQRYRNMFKDRDADEE